MRSKRRVVRLRDVLEGFFQSYLPRDRGASFRTIHTYREALALWSDDLARRFRAGRVGEIRLHDLRPEHVLRFLSSLEQQRGNRPSTRNARLAAIKSLFRYVALAHPQHQTLAELVARIPAKLTRPRAPDSLSREEVAALLRAPDASRPPGLRDRAILQLLYNTGARASEVAQLTLGQLTLRSDDGHVRLLGKGNRWRTCPLFAATVRWLRHYLEKVRPAPKGPDVDRVFLNRRGRGLTRQGVRGIVRRYVRLAAEHLPDMRSKRLTTHSLRHTTASHMLLSGIDPLTIRSWLGHVHLDTTLEYLGLDTADKRTALETFRKLIDWTGNATDPGLSASSAKLQDWLNSL